MATTAQDIADQIAELAAQLPAKAEMQVRKDIASEFTSRAKASDTAWFTSVAGKDVTLTPDFLAGMALVCKALKDTDFDY